MRLDTRLVPAALAAWAMALIAGAVAIPGGPLPGLLALALAAALLARGHLGGVIVVAVLGAVALAAWAHGDRIGAGPLAQAAADDVRGQVEVVTQGDPLLVAGGTWGPQRSADRVQVPVTVVRLLVPGRGEWDLDAPALLRLPPPLAAAPPAGTRVLADVRIRPAPWTRGAAAVLEADDTPIAIGAPGPLTAGAAAVRQGLRNSLTGVPDDPASLVAGLAVGDESRQPPELAQAMRVSGLSHLTAVSGGNTALVMIAVLVVARILLLPVPVRVGATLAALGAYLLVVGPEPSVLRAGVMGAVSLLAVLEGGPRRGLSALAVAVVVLLILSPALAWSLGFALSVTATAGLLLIAPRLRAGLVRPLAWLPPDSLPRRAGEGAVDALTLTIGAQVATAPILAGLGDGLSLVAVPANLLAAPAVAPVTVLGLAAAVIAPVFPALAVIPAHLAALPAAWIAWLAHTGASMPGATLPWPGGLAGAAAVIVVAAVVALAWIRGGARVGRLVTVVLTAALVVVALRPPDRAGWPPENWIAVVCDVGQGDAMVLRADDGSAVLVDAGPDPAGVDRCLGDLGIGHLAAVVLSHFHADHVEGLPGALRGRTVDVILVTPHGEPVEQAERVSDWADSAGVPVRSVTAGEEVRVGEDLVWQALWPERLIQEGSTPNNASVVLLAQVHGIRLLLLGDAEPAAQVAVRARLGGEPGPVDVVKVAHHGSANQDPRLPSWTGARLALISAGAGNRYGHPAPETVAAWAGIGALVARTDESGDIAVVSDGRLGLVTRR